MKLIDLTCTKCGATLKVNSELTKCMCQYCGNEMLVDQEVQKHEFTNGFDFGYQAELGRQKAQQVQNEKIALDKDGTNLAFWTCVQLFCCAGILSPFLLYYGSKMNKRHLELYGRTNGFITIAQVINTFIAVMYGLMLLLILLGGSINISEETEDSNEIISSTAMIEKSIVAENKTNTQENVNLTEECLDEVNYVDEETLSYRIGACLADALNLRLKGKMSEDDYNKYKNSVLELEMKILSCNTNGEDDSVYEQDVINAENYLKQYYENSTESEYEFELEFSNTDGYKFTCSNDNDIKLYTNKYYDVYSGQTNDLYYAIIPNGEYRIEYIGGDGYIPDQVGRICTNRWMGYSQTTGEPINNDVYTIENVPDDNSEVYYEYEHFTCINRTTEGDGRITISNGDTLVIDDNTEQILEIYFDTDGKGLIRLYKIN